MVDNHGKGGGGGCLLGAIDIAKIDDHNIIFMDHSMASGQTLVWMKEASYRTDLEGPDLTVQKTGMHNKLESKDKHAHICMHAGVNSYQQPKANCIPVIKLQTAPTKTFSLLIIQEAIWTYYVDHPMQQGGGQGA